MIYYFDSYGARPDQPLSLISQNTKKMCNETENFLSQLILKSGFNVDFNTAKLQGDNNEICTCGRWVICRCIFHDVSNAAFAQLFGEGNKGFTPDELAYEFTKGIIGK
jgi:hypothetical protein